MNKYDPDTACIKCGNKGTFNKYESGYRSAWHESIYMEYNDIGRKQAEYDATQHERECIIWTCSSCGYSWYEAPLTPMEPIPLVYPEEPEPIVPSETGSWRIYYSSMLKAFKEKSIFGDKP